MLKSPSWLFQPAGVKSMVFALLIHFNHTSPVLRLSTTPWSRQHRNELFVLNARRREVAR